MGLKSLVKIKDSLEGKQHKSGKAGKKSVKSGKNKIAKQKRMTEPALQLQQKLMLEKLDELTGSVEKLRKKVDEIRRKLEQKKLL